MYSVCTLLKVVGYYDVSVLSISVMGFQKKGLDGAGVEIRGILVANANMFSHLLPGFSCGSKHLLLP